MPRPSPAAAVLARHGWPTPPGPGLGFTAEDDALLARGWPELRLLTEERIPKPLDAATRALRAIDPTLRRRVPRAVATAYLGGYANGPGPDGAAGVGEVDLALLGRILAAPHLRGMGDTYGSWRFPEVLYLFEAFLGAEPVARALVDHLRDQARDLASWGFAGQDPRRTNAAPHHLAFALPPLLHRTPTPVAIELRRLLAEIREPEGERVPLAWFALIRRLADPSGPSDPLLQVLEGPLALVEGDAVGTARMASIGHNLLWWPARICWLCGTSLLGGKLAITGHAVDRIVEQVALIRDPGVVRLVGYAAIQRTGKAAAGAWLTSHAEYARPILADLAALDDPKERKAAEAGLALIGTAPEPSAPLAEDQVEVEIAAIFAGLGEALRSTGKKSAQLAAIRSAHEDYAEVRSAAGDPTPEAYFTHRFGDFGLGEWAMLAVEALDD